MGSSPRRCGGSTRVTRVDHRGRVRLRGCLLLPATTAFTLIELVMVLVIMAILSALALPRFSGAIVNHRLDAASRRIALDLTFAQRRAKITSASQTLEFYPGTDSYELVGVASLDRPAHGYIVDLAEDPYAARITKADFDGDTTLVFDGFGLPESGGWLAIRVGGYYKTITVGSLTGQVETSDVVAIPGGAAAVDPVIATPAKLDY